MLFLLSSTSILKISFNNLIENSLILGQSNNAMSDFQAKRFSNQDDDEEDYDDQEAAIAAHNRQSVIKFKDVEDEDDLEREVRIGYIYYQL